MERRLGSLPGIVSYTVDLRTDSANVTYDAKQIRAEEISAALAEIGYRPQAIREDD